MALIEQLCAETLDSRIASRGIVRHGGDRSLRALERVSWRDFVESVSAVERILERDPAGVYARMDFVTRDRYRHQVEKMARRSKLTEKEVAEKVIAIRRRKRLRHPLTKHVGYYLIGRGIGEFQKRLGAAVVGFSRDCGTLAEFVVFFEHRCVTALVVAGFEWLAGPFELWMALLPIPATQAALEICERAGEPHITASRASQHGFFGWNSRRFENHGGGSDPAVFRSQLRAAAGGSGNPVPGES